MMSKKHYVAIAEIISNRRFVNPSGIVVLNLNCLVDDLTDYFKEDNPNFDRTRFLNACGVK